jgi:hypothetical protein
MVNAILAFGVGIPALFFYCLNYTMTNGFNYYMAFAYNVFRIGPYFMNFAYVYTLCHKEGHSHTGLYKEPYNKVLRYVWNWWIGFFYGVCPATFAIGHTKNHHKYNNGPLDILSTGDMQRDSFWNWVRYIPRFFLYALNITTIQQFYAEGNIQLVNQMFYGSAIYWLGVFMVYKCSPLFCLAYVIYPLFEQTILLCAINWSWHAMIDPDEPDNQFVNSMTLFGDQVNVLNEDYHVVHHQYPAAHWKDHPDLYELNKADYVDKNGKIASMFNDTHAMEMFFLCMLGEYEKLAEKFVDPTGKLTMEEKIQMMKDRLRTCTWGPHKSPNAKPQLMMSDAALQALHKSQPTLEKAKKKSH